MVEKVLPRLEKVFGLIIMKRPQLVALYKRCSIPAAYGRSYADRFPHIHAAMLNEMEDG